MRIIPAIDIIAGKCVRLTKGDYSTKKVYNEDPLEVAREFEAHGLNYLHLVDLDGAREKRLVNHHILEAIASKTKLTIDYGGGLRTDDDVRIAFESGAVQVTGGSIAVKDRHTFMSWLKNYGPGRIILGADASGGKIAVSGWQEDSGLELLPFIRKYQKAGIEYVICTDVSKDGMLQGPAIDLYKEILRKTANIDTVIGPSGVEDHEIPGIKLIASGGISTIEDLKNLKDLGCEGAILGKAIYEGNIALKALSEFTGS